MKTIFFYFIMLSLCSCAPRIKSITSYEKLNDSLIKRSYTVFDIKGNETKEIRYGQLFDHVTQVEYKDFVKTSTTHSICYADHKCDLKLYTLFNYDNEKKIERQTTFVNDSLVWQIKEKHFYKNVEVITTYSWEHEATQVPNYNDAFVIIDTLSYDTKNRLIKKVSYSKLHEKPHIELFHYNKNGYVYEIKGTRIDTTYTHTYSKEEQKIKRMLPRFAFTTPNQLRYSIEFY